MNKPDKQASLLQHIKSGCDALVLTLNEHQYQQLLDYVLLFEKWNKAFNLSAVRQIEDIIDRHIIDSLSVVPLIKAKHLLDVGTGGGLPGIPLAIMYPETNVVLLDSNGKKTRFLFQVKTALGLDNVTIENLRVENYRADKLFDGIASRAFASLEDMVNSSQHLLADDGALYAMKGQNPVDEIARLPEGFVVKETIQLQVPGTEGERHLVKVGRQS